MIQKLLCRWWYALEWPAKKDLRPAPPSYEALEGYPGVFICVEVRVGGLACASTAKYMLHLVSSVAHYVGITHAVLGAFTFSHVPVTCCWFCAVSPLRLPSVWQGVDTGKLLDVRNKETCPCFTNFANKVGEILAPFEIP